MVPDTVKHDIQRILDELTSGTLDVNIASGGAGDGAIQDGANASIEATVLDYTGSNPLAVRLTDTDGNYVTAGGGTQYTEDAAAATNPVGTAPILIRTDTPATQVTTDGDNVAQRGTNYGAAYVQLVTSAGAYIDSVGGGTEYTEDVATANPIVGKAIMVERDDALTTVTPIEGDNIGLRGTAEGALWTQDFNSDGILSDTTAIKTSLETAGGQLVNLGANNDVTVTGSVTADLGVNNDVTVTSGSITALHGVTGIAHGVKTITSAGTDEALAGSTACKKVDIQSQTDNTGLIAVGATGVDATVATGTGVILYPGDVYSLEIDNLADIFIDSTVNGEGVRYTYYT